MKRFRLYYDVDKEQVWLNKMCEEGWAVKSFFFGIHTFEKCKKGEYIYQIDLLDAKNSRGFLGFLEENGVEVVSIWYRWVLLRKKACDGPFELYSDSESKIEQYKRIRNLCIFILINMGLGSLVWLRNYFNTGIPFLIFDIGFVGMVFTIFLRTIVKCNNKIANLKKIIF